MTQTVVNDAFTAPPELRAFRHGGSHLRFWLTAFGLLALDLWSKHWIFSNLDVFEVRTIIPSFLEFRRSMNDGAVFGSFTGMVGTFMVASLFALAFVLYMFGNSSRRMWHMHVAFGLILSGALGNLYDRAFVQADVVKVDVGEGDLRTYIGVRRSPEGEFPLKLGRWPDGKELQIFREAEVRSVRRQGVVRDFLKFVPVLPESWPYVGGRDAWPWIFNVADASLVTGVIAMLLHAVIWPFADRRARRREGGVSAVATPTGE